MQAQMETARAYLSPGNYNYASNISELRPFPCWRWFVSAHLAFGTPLMFAIPPLVRRSCFQVEEGIYDTQFIYVDRRSLLPFTLAPVNIRLRPPLTFLVGRNNVVNNATGGPDTIWLSPSLYNLVDRESSVTSCFWEHISLQPYICLYSHVYVFTVICMSLQPCVCLYSHVYV